MNLANTLFNFAVSVGAKLTASSRFWWAARPAIRAYGWVTLAAKRGEPQRDVAAIAREWQRMFPNPAALPIVKVDEDTAYAEIHVRCPLRGTGNVDACFRMMEYDRRMLEHIGGQFVVVRSQAEQGVDVCQVAMRRPDSPLDGLEHAHLRVRSERGSRPER